MHLFFSRLRFIIYMNVKSITVINTIFFQNLSVQISDSVLASLERLVVVLFNNFTRLAKGSKFLCCKAVVRVLFNLSSKGAVLRRFLSEVGMYQKLQMQKQQLFYCFRWFKNLLKSGHAFQSVNRFCAWPCFWILLNIF